MENKNYEIGYYNKPWNQTDWRTLATAVSPNLAELIVKSFNEEYERVGFSLRVEIKK